jgi:serine-type D-Ala-D-Ala carboxypeptidase (penicillin-binding protein 5/6)
MSRELRRRQARRRQVRRRRLVAGLVLLLLLGAGAFAVRGDETAAPQRAAAATPKPVELPEAPAGQTALGPLSLAVDLSQPDRLRVPFKRPPRAGLLVNLDTGEVLWRRNATRTVPIASVTKMMTALVTVDRLQPDDKARITRQVLNYSGSGVGLLPRGKRVKVETLLYGLMLPSGNDAARALALRVAGSLGGMVDLMNERAAALGLQCTRFASVEGLSDRNRACPADLAVLTRELLDTPRLAKIVKTRKIRLPMQIKGGRVGLWNHNPLLMQGYSGVLGVKTGYTEAAGRCLVAAARRRGVRLAAIVLRSRDPGRQARQLLDRGFRALD